MTYGIPPLIAPTHIPAAYRYSTPEPAGYWADGESRIGRVLFAQGGRDNAGTWNVETGEVRDLPAIPSPAEYQFSKDGTLLYVTRSLPGSEIWLLDLE